MESRSRSGVLLLFAMLSIACAREPTSPTYRAVLRTDHASYFVVSGGPGNTAPRTLTVILQYTNQSDAPIYLERCPADTHPLLGSQSVDSDGVALGSSEQVAFACGAGAALTVAPGAIRTDTFTVSAPSPLPASMRFFYLASSCATDMGPCSPFLPESDRVSAPILVLAAPSAAPAVMR